MQEPSPVADATHLVAERTEPVGGVIRTSAKLGLVDIGGGTSLNVICTPTELRQALELTEVLVAQLPDCLKTTSVKWHEGSLMLNYILLLFIKYLAYLTCFRQPLRRPAFQAIRQPRQLEVEMTEKSRVASRTDRLIQLASVA